MQELLAKSGQYKGVSLTLEQHLSDTALAARSIFRDRILKNWCRFFRLSDPDQFLLHLEVAALFHDIGKANAHFLRVLVSREIQTLPHESISALILHLDVVRNWLKPSQLNCDVVAAAVLSHHLRSNEDADKGKRWAHPRNGDRVDLYLDSPQIQRILDRISLLLSLPKAPDLPSRWQCDSPEWDSAYKNAVKAARKLDRAMRKDPDMCSLIMATKAGLIASDSVASGIFRTRGSESISQWVNDVLHQPRLTSEDLEQCVLQPRYRSIRTQTGTFELNDPQKMAYDLDDRMLTLMGCGSGKTIFAYKWMQGVLDRHAFGRVIFLYPTRGTATEGFRDYVAWAPESEAALVSGTANYELSDMQENPPESLKDRNFEQLQTEERLFALGFWQKRYFSATVDQFLSFLTYSYSGICLLPVLVDSALVIDEVHSFSGRMFEGLKSFLTYFDHPTLAMTATLPKVRQLDLTTLNTNSNDECGLTLFPQLEEREALKTLQQAEDLERYSIHSLSSDTNREFLLGKAVEAYRSSKRVLWIVNTVDRCREIAQLLSDRLSESVLVYHSRFKLSDRKARHQETVDAFALNRDEQAKPAIAVTTQVCEMSLDLDADLLITERAPIPSLVQRFGRANRHAARRKDNRLADIYVYPAPNMNPYSAEDMKGVESFLDSIAGIASQTRLSDRLHAFSCDGRKEREKSPFVKFSYWSMSESFREDDDYLTSAVLNADLDAVQKRLNPKGESEPIDGYILQVPRKQCLDISPPEWLPKYLKVADAALYNIKTGFGK